MKRHLVRSVKYFLMLCVLYVALMWLMNITGATLLTLRDDAAILFGTTRGWLMIAAAVALSAAYPKFGFVTRRVEGDIAEHRRQILSAMEACGYELRGEDDGRMVFRAGPLQRALMLFEDEIIVGQYGQWIEISGLRRMVVRAAIRLEGYMGFIKRDNGLK